MSFRYWIFCVCSDSFSIQASFSALFHSRSRIILWAVCFFSAFTTGLSYGPHWIASKRINEQTIGKKFNNVSSNNNWILFDCTIFPGLVCYATRNSAKNSSLADSPSRASEHISIIILNVMKVPLPHWKPCLSLNACFHCNEEPISPNFQMDNENATAVFGTSLFPIIAPIIESLSHKYTHTLGKSISRGK